MFITGPSGSGKSSLVRAGLIHALKLGAIKNSDGWLYETIKPGRDPIESLASAFSRLKSPELAYYFREHIAKTDILHECAEFALDQPIKTSGLCFSLTNSRNLHASGERRREAGTFIDILTNAAMVENGRVIILFSMRSDFIPNCATYPQLNALLNQEFIQIGAMQPEELVSAIAQPALRVGLRIDPDLISQIIDDMQGEPGALPLMQFALKDLFDSQHENDGVIGLTLNEYLGRGGIRKALERHADDSFNKLDPHEQELARSIFSGLIEIGRGTLDTRRTARFDELIPANTITEEVKAIVGKLADARLITTDEKNERDTVTISHEKLIDAWPWLKKLVNENRDVIALQNEIAADAREWEEHKRDTSYLYSGARLVNANEKLQSKELVLSGTAFEYIRAGQVRQRRGRIVLIGSIATVFALLVTAVVIFANLTKKANEQANIALARQVAAQAQSNNFTRSSKQMVASLLSIQSLKMFPNTDATSFLINSNLSAHTISRMTHDGLILDVAFSPDGKFVVSGSDDGTARVWIAASGVEVARMTLDGGVNSVAFSPDGKFVVSGSDDGIARVWIAATGVEVARMTHVGAVYVVAFSPDGKYVVSGSDDGTARVWIATTGLGVARMTLDGGVNSVAFSPDGKFVVSGSDDGTARVWIATSGVEVARMTHDESLQSVAFSPDGKYVVSGSDDGTARVWIAASGVEVARMTHDGPVSAVTFNPDGKYVASSSYDRTARVWEAATGVEVAKLTYDSGVTKVTFSPDGKYVVSGSLDGTARVWEAATGLEVARVTHDDFVNPVTFSPDGKHVVSGSNDKTARVWVAPTGLERVRIIHDGPVDAFAFSLDGKYVVSVGEDNTARVWEAATGAEISRMTDGWMESVAFSPDGKYVVSGSSDGTHACGKPPLGWKFLA